MHDAAHQRHLVERAKQGDHEAFMALLQPELAGLHQTAFYLARHAEEARDLAQTACVRAFLAIGRFHADAPLRPWLQRILRNVFLDQRKRAQVRREIATEDPGDHLAEPHGPDETSPLALLLGQERQQALTEHIRALPPGFQEVLVLCDIQGMRYEEVGQALQLPLGTVKSRLSRARLQLRARLLAAGEPFASLARKQHRGPR